MPRGIDGNDGGNKRVGHDLHVELPPKTETRSESRRETTTDGVGFRRDGSTNPVGGPAVTGSAKLLDMMLASDKSAFLEGLDPSEKEALLERELAKRIGQLLLTSPYGAPQEVAFRRICEDPFVASQMPELAWVDLERLHERYPTIVPDPNTPLDMGATFQPTNEGYLDIFISYFATAPGRRSEIERNYGRAPHAQASRYRTPYEARYRGAAPMRHVVMGRVRQTGVGRINTGGHLEQLLVRRVIKNAPPTWGPEQIAEEFNRYLDYYAPLVYYGDHDSQEAARERATMTPARVRALMLDFPQESGAIELHERQQALRQTLIDQIDNAAPGENLYATLVKACETLEAQAQRPIGNYHRDSRNTSRVFTPPPTSNATLTPDDLVELLSSDPSVDEPLQRLLGARQGSTYKTLAEQIAETFGSNLSGASVAEVVAIMKHKDPVFNAPLVHHLVQSFPEILGALRVEDSPIKTRFLLANQVADAMEKMFVGASLDEVAAYLRETKPGFSESFPDFSGEDVHLLQMAYPFLPQWSTKPETVAATSTSLSDLLEFATAGLERNDANELQKLVLETLPEGLEEGEIPNDLKNAIDRAFARNALNLVASELNVKPASFHAGGQENLVESYATFLRVPPGTRQLTEKELGAIITELRDDGTLPRGSDDPARIAKVLHQARNLDFTGVRKSLADMLTGKTSARTTDLELSALYLGRRGIHSELELSVYKNEELRASFRRFARIPLRLPMVQKVVDKYRATHPFANTNVMFVQHMLGQAYPQISGFKQLGMDPTQAIFVGIPYHKNNEVERAVAESFGVDVRVSDKDVGALYAEIDRGVDDTVKRYLENGQDCLIVADGPHAREYFRKTYLTEHPEWADHFRFTEQTAFGDRPEYRVDRSLRTVSYARRELKAQEAEWVGTSVVRAVSAVLNQMGTGIDEKPVLIMGGGSIGRGTAEAFLGSKGNVSMYDPNPTPSMRAWAEEHSVELLSDKNDITKNKFLLVGCSGYLSLDEEAILDADSNSILVSASSKLVEIDMKKLRELATDEQGRLRRILAAEVNNQQTWHYWLQDGTIRTVIADGLPANFNDINSVPPELIDTAMSMSLASAVQAMTGDELGFFDLKDADHDMLADHFENYLRRLKGLPPLGVP